MDVKERMAKMREAKAAKRAARLAPDDDRVERRRKAARELRNALRKQARWPVLRES